MQHNEEIGHCQSNLLTFEPSTFQPSVLLRDPDQFLARAQVRLAIKRAE
jgi:hypothetical protein